MIELDVKIGTGDLYDYTLRHACFSGSGLLGIGLGILLVVWGCMEQRWVLVLLGAFYLLYMPIMLFLKSRQQARGEMFSKPLHYVLDEQGLTISQGEASANQSWGDMVKAISTRRSIIIYTSKMNATILPKKQLGASYEAVVNIIKTNMPANKVKIK